MVALVTLAAFEELAVSTALPVAATDLGGVREYALAFSLFITTSLLGTVLAGGWADGSGPQPPLLAGLVTFGIGLLVCGVAPDFPVLLLGRGIAGFGAGMQIVAIYVIVSDRFEVEQHARIFAWLSAAWVVPAIVGPALAGWVAVAFSWRAVFLAVPPLAILAWLVMLRGMAAPPPAAEPTAAAEEVLPNQGRPGASRPSVPAMSNRTRSLLGLALAGGALVMQWGAQNLDQLYGAPLALVGLVAMGLAVPRLLPTGAFRLRLGLPSVVVTRGLLTASFYAAETFVPLLLVTERGLKPDRAGLVLTGGALGWAAGSWLLSRSWLHWSRRRVLVTGSIVLALATVTLVAVGLDWVSAYSVVPIWLVAGFGMGLAYTATSVLALLFAADGEEGRASSALQLCDGIGGILGLAVAGAVFAALHTPGGDDGPILAGIWAGLAVVALGAMVAGSRARLQTGTEAA